MCSFCPSVTRFGLGRRHELLRSGVGNVTESRGLAEAIKGPLEFSRLPIRSQDLTERMVEM